MADDMFLQELTVVLRFNLANNGLASRLWAHANLEKFQNINHPGHWAHRRWLAPRECFVVRPPPKGGDIAGLWWSGGERILKFDYASCYRIASCWHINQSIVRAYLPELQLPWRGEKDFFCFFIVCQLHHKQRYHWNCWRRPKWHVSSFDVAFSPFNSHC